jgi:hypothetical protein
MGNKRRSREHKIAKIFLSLFPFSNMLLLFYLIFAIFFFLVLLLTVPYISSARESLILAFDNQGVVKQFLYFGYILVFFILSNLANAVWNYRYYRQLEHTHNPNNNPLGYGEKKVECERDIILSLALLLSILAIHQLYNHIRDQSKLNKKFIAMQSQAKNASAAYLAQINNSKEEINK